MTALRSLLASALLAGGAVVSAAPPAVVPWTDAAAHVGELITIEGTIHGAELVGNTCTMTFDPDDPQAVRVVLIVPLVSDIGPRADLRYRGHRVRASGRLRRFAGRPEMVIQAPDQIEILDGPTTTSTTSTTTTTLARPIAAAPAGTPVTAPPSPPPVVAPPPPAPVPAPIPEMVTGPSPACIAARDAWRDAAGRADADAAALRRCLGASPYRCGDVAEQLRAALGVLTTAEASVRDQCE